MTDWQITMVMGVLGGILGGQVLIYNTLMSILNVLMHGRNEKWQMDGVSAIHLQQQAHINRPTDDFHSC